MNSAKRPHNSYKKEGVLYIRLRIEWVENVQGQQGT